MRGILPPQGICSDRQWGSGLRRNSTLQEDTDGISSLGNVAVRSGIADAAFGGVPQAVIENRSYEYCAHLLTELLQGCAILRMPTAVASLKTRHSCWLPKLRHSYQLWLTYRSMPVSNAAQTAGDVDGKLKADLEKLRFSQSRRQNSVEIQ